MFEVLKSFSDLKDGNHVYMVGDTFPRHGFSVSEERLKELTGSNNTFGCPLIRAVQGKDPEATIKAEIKPETVKADREPIPVRKARRRANKA